MSVSRVKYLKQYFPITSYSFDSGISTISANNHLLFTGIPVSLTSDKQYFSYNSFATVISANSFSVPSSEYIHNLTHFCINGYVSGQTGRMEPQTIPRATGTETIVQSYVNGTGGATYNVDVSLDKDHWISLGSIVHGSQSGNTAYLTISPGWAYMRANVASIGANTNLVIMTGE